MIHCNLTLMNDWGCRWQCITITRSMDSSGQEFLDFLDQAFWCHVGMARSSWLHRCGMGCIGTGAFLWTADVVGTVRAWFIWVAGVAGVGCMCCAGCGSAGCAAEKWCIFRACSVAVVPLGTVLTAITLHSWRCLCMQQYVEPLLVHTW